MAQNSKRGRHNNRRRQNPNNINRSMDSTGPEVKIRGTAAQIFEKYQALARDAASAGDRIRAESLLQHGEHYYRLMRAMQAEQERRDEQRAERQERHSNPQETDTDDDTNNEAEVTVTSTKPAVSEDADGDEATASTEDPAQADSDESSEDDAPKQRRTRRRRPTRKSLAEDEAADTENEQPVAAAE